MTVTIADARLVDALIVAHNLCREDVLELSATRDVFDADRLALDAMSGTIRKVASVDGFPVMLFGATFLEPHRVSVWGIKSPGACRAMLSVTKYIRRTIIPSLRSLGVDSAACVVHSGNTRSLRWLASFGFKPEAIRPGLGTRNRDIPLCAMVRRDNDLFAHP